MITTAGKKVSNELSKGNLDKLFLKLQDASIIACEVNVNSIIAVMVPEKENIGLIFNRLDKAKEKIRKILE
jgi:predicted regulator of Ras-like GTPase activity (Roadblock/LC7/MglB family)